MRYGFLLAMLVCSATVQADAFKCTARSGEIIFSDTPCDDGEQFSKVIPSESVQDSEAARRELEKQKAYAERVAAENEAARKSTGGAVSLPETPSSPSASPSGLSFPGSGSGGSGTGAGPTPASGAGPGDVPRGIPTPTSRK